VLDVVRGDERGEGGSMHIQHSRKNVEERVQGKVYEDSELTKQSLMYNTKHHVREGKHVRNNASDQKKTEHCFGERLQNCYDVRMPKRCERKDMAQIAMRASSSTNSSKSPMKETKLCGWGSCIKAGRGGTVLKKSMYRY